ALAAAEQAIDSAAPLMSLSVIARAQYLRARAFFGLGHYERALESLKSSRDELVGLGDFSLAVRTQATFSCWLALHGHQAPAQEMLEQAHELAKGYGGPGDLARIESAAAQIAGLRGEVHAAKAHLLRAVAFYEELGDEQAVANAFNSLGARALDVPELEEAQKYFSSALAKFESLQDRRRARGARSNLALIALLRGDVASASGQFRTLIESSKGDPHGSGSAPLNLAKAQFETGRLGEAMDLVEAALDTARKSQSRPVLEDGQQTLARIHLHRGDLELARLWFRKSAETGDAIGGPRLELRALTNRVELLLAEGDAVGAESIAREATRLAARHSLGARGSTRLVAQALLHRGDVAQARQTLEGLETRGDDLETRRIGILEARIRALTGDHKLAVQSLHEISRWAKERGAWTIDTEANLALVEAERPRQGPEWTRGRLTSIETDSCGRSWASYCRRAKQLASGDDRGPGRGVSGLEAVME
ncbi:MAG: tetratricopeptide repeat protein, partial [Acidobacteriota bacterium]